MKVGLIIVLAIVVLAVGAIFTRERWQHHLFGPATLDAATIAALYETPKAPVDGPLSVYHLGHSLVGRDMPAMLEQMAASGHSHRSQLGWGTSLKDHFAGPEAINGFDTENDHPRFRDAKDALASGEYDAVVFTEMVELRDAIKYHQSARWLGEWLKAAVAGNPSITPYLYETWHRLDDPDGWLERIDTDLPARWEGEVLDPAIASLDSPRPVYVIPGGQVMAAFVRAIEGEDAMPGLSDRRDLFKRDADGTQDNIHPNAWGAYLIALAHYAVLYGKDPRGLTSEVTLADGTPMPPLPDGAAQLMQQVVWDVVTTYPRTGVSAASNKD